MKNKLRYTLYWIYYSFKELFIEPFRLLEELKKPKMWATILYIIFFGSVYARNYTVMKWTLPMILIVYLVRQKRDRKYIGEMFIRDLRKDNDTDLVKEHYERYSKQCFFSKTEPISFEEWKKNEIVRIDEKRKSDLDAQQ